ncbi:SpaA isopeptide-forming pilin-related protein [Latilactobacillus sakei]|uniref:SpaA isopeptide-forming pilin-related protein n=1 Tax=Latilactobacillus sakei TaxID=1599 RepID=A0AAF0GQY7_LATSK|nr:SpaA isopeptide-forming pilin-related protein [Latilactobacillus sakei]WGI19431.1 SpaA isopeptide-forming pilin-related protein [Latilactobacillus sakei]
MLASLISSAVANVNPVNASADYGSTFITKGELLDKDGNVATNVGRYDQLLAHYDFEIPDGTTIKAGDTMTVTLPKQLVVAGGASFDLRDDAGNVIGTATVNSATGTVTVKFTDFYETHPNNKKGSFEVHTTWDQNEITVNKDIPLDWGSNGSTVHIGDDQGPGADEGLYKWGSVDLNDPSLIHWTARVNRKEADIKNAVFTDTVGANQELVSGSVKAEYVTYTTGDNYTHDAPVPDSLVSENGTSGFTINFGDLNGTVLINYDTRATDNGASDTYSNSAQLTGDNITTENVTVNTPHTGGNGNGSGSNQAVELTKTDADNAAKVLAGAHFKLVKVDETPNKVIKADVVTDANGKLRVEGLSNGKYQLIETQAPTGYELDSTPVGFEIIDNQTGAVTVSKVDKQILGDVVLTKTDKDQNHLSGAVFELQDSTGKVLQKDLTTDSNGQITVKDLPYGTYQFVETKAPDGYDIDTTPKPFKIDGTDKTVNISMVNQLTSGSVILTKKDSKDSSVLQGAVFELRDASGKLLQSGLTTNASGQLEVKDLTPGKYYFVETKAPTGYDISKKHHDFEIKKGQTTAKSVEVTNQLTPGSVILTKTDADNGAVLQGAVFELQDASGKVLKSGLTTDASGKLEVTDLDPGDYQLVETKAPAGYKLDTTPQKITIKKNQKTAFKIDMTNKLTPGSVVLTKKDAEDGTVLQGAIFEIQDASGAVIKSGLITDASGKLAVNDLKPGKYYFVETKAPAGYDLNKTPKEFEITKGQTTAKTVDMTNKLTPGSVVLTKKDAEDGTTLQGAVFEIQDASGKVLKTGLTTDASGKLAVNDLKPGKYYFVETKAPAGYDLNKTPKEFEITKGQTTAKTVDMTNKLTPGSVVLTKKDAEDGTTLQGAVFEIQDASGAVIKSGLTTDASGKLAVNDLKPGKYYFVETKAPAGYDLNKTPKEFTITKGQTTATPVDMTNKLTPGSVVLTKKDAEDGTTLQGAVFEIQDASGKVLKSGLTTDASGKLAVNDLKPGKYYFVETKAPAGYDLDKTAKSFTITKGQKSAVLIDMVNAQTPGSVILTKTDDKSGVTLQGAVFELQDQNGKTLKTGLTTDASGKLAVNNLKPGTYQFVETKAPTGYDLDKTPVKVVIKKGQTAAYQVTKTDQLTPGSVILTKADNKTGETLQGAVFELQDQTGKVLQSGLTTDATGQIVVKNLEPGDYQFVETKAPTGYDIDKTPVKVTVIKGQTSAAKVTKTDKLTAGSVILTKTDNKSGITLQGAIFELQDQNGKVLQSGLTTDATGQFVVKDLEPGDYQFVETKAPTGYDLDKTPVKVTITKGQTSAAKVTKTDKLTAGSVILTKTDNKSGITLQGAIFELQDQNGKVLQSGLTTDATGQLVVKDLEPGDYQFVETKAPIGYDLDQKPVKFTIKKGQTSAIKVTKADRLTPGSVILTKINNKNGATLQGAIFELQDQNGKVLQSNLTTDATGQIAVKDLEPGDYQFVETKAPVGYQLDKTAVKFTITKNQKTAVKVTKADKAIPGSVILTKKDDQTGAALAGAIFKIVDANQKVVKENLKSDQNGQIIVTNLEPGQYSFIETKAPTGYVLDATPVQFTVKAQKQAVQVNKENKQKQHEVRLEKRDQATNQLLAGAVFELRNQQGKVLQSGLTTDKSGVLLLTDLKVGQYQLVETKAPNGYQLDNSPLHFTITKNQDSLTLIKYNVRQPEKPTVPTDPEKPTTPTKPVTPTTPTKPVKPTTPTKPAKPGTKLPQTGADMNNGLLYLGLELIMVVSLAYWQINKKKHEQ